MIYKLNDLSRQQLSLLVHSQKAAFLGHDSYRRFGARFPLHVKVTHSLNAQAFTPGQGVFCYVHRPVIGSGLVIAEVSVLTATNEPTTALTTAVYESRSTTAVSTPSSSSSVWKARANSPTTRVTPSHSAKASRCSYLLPRKPSR